jgi:hypothetical protein
VSSLLVARADWRELSQYPHVNMTDSTRWAWEFLRRLRGYETDYLSASTPAAGSNITDSDEALRLKWEVTKLISPSVQWKDLPSDFNFLANTVESFTSTYTHAQRYESTPWSPRISREIPIRVSDNQLIVRISLDGNVLRQMEVLKDIYRRNKEATYGQKLKRRRHIHFDAFNPEVDVPVEESNQTGRVELFNVVPHKDLILEFAENIERVRLKHLHFSLRAVDALATIPRVKPEQGSSPDEHVISALFKQFEKERYDGLFTETVARHAGTFRVGVVDSWVEYARRYTIKHQYPLIAASDLENQLKNDPSDDEAERRAMRQKSK